MFATILFILSLALVLWIVVSYFRTRKPVPPAEAPPEPETLNHLLEKHVAFYRKLDDAQQAVFLQRAERFLETTRITGVGEVQVTDLDRALVAASAIIPISAFPEWSYRNISEVLLYPATFNKEYAVEGADRNVLGMVGEGAMNGQMILSQQALRGGFSRSDAQNTAIHEFVHLIDKADGSTDGIPEYLIDNTHLEPWLRVMHQEIRKIRNGESDLNPYAATNEAEFLAVTAEYFFEKPALLREHHPKLYELLHEMFGDASETGEI
jgi:Mlc titration factor MtfA (ptsG expression regulator)